MMPRMSPKTTVHPVGSKAAIPTTIPPASTEEDMDSVYRERAHLVAHLAAAYPSSIGYHDPSEPDWAVVIIELPKGQVSWHVSPDDMDLFKHVRRTEINSWDGHDTEEKYRRLDDHTQLIARGY